MNRKLLNLLALNAKKGEFRAESSETGNTIYVYDVIVASDEDASWFGGVSAESFVKALAGMSGDVNIRINSPGGDVFGGKAMAAAIREYAGNITVHVDGYAASAASYVATSAKKTVVSPGSMMMIHKAWTIDLGNADDFRKTAGLLDKIDGTIAADYANSAERRGKSGQDFIELMAEETWFTAEEAIDAGLADELAEDGPKASIDWDLSAYERDPRAEEIDALRAEVAALTLALAAVSATEKTDEIEPQRPDPRSDLLLRPAA